MRMFLFLLAFFSSSYLFAQSSDWQMKILEKMKNDGKIKKEEKVMNNDDQKTSSLDQDSSIILPETEDSNNNETEDSWNETVHSNQLNNAEYIETVPVSDAEYMDRLSKLPNIIELPYNPTVRNCINLYVERRRELVEYMLGLESFYFPMIEEALGKYGLPLELKYLAVVESALNPVALSRMGASGLWQFMLSTGKSYGLIVNSLVDERRDPIKSTDAACRHLKDLYDMYEDWSLAIAAYNCGSGNVNKAIRRAGGEKDYWAIYPYLPRETRSYVPLFIAANYVMNYYASHQLFPAQTSLPLSTDTIAVNKMIHFDQIAEVLKIDKEMIRMLNPQYKQEVIPGNIRPQILKLPPMHIYAFVEKEEEIASHRADDIFTNRKYVEMPEKVVSSNRAGKIIHKVARGETIVTIGNKYGISASAIRKWNYLGSNKVPVGKKLVLYVDNGGNTTRKSNTKYALSSSNESQKSKSSSDAVHYKVQRGDSFHSIAKKYPGYSSNDLMKLNKITNSNLKVGQYILVPKI